MSPNGAAVPPAPDRREASDRLADDAAARALDRRNDRRHRLQAALVVVAMFGLIVQGLLITSAVWVITPPMLFSAARVLWFGVIRDWPDEARAGPVFWIRTAIYGVGLGFAAFVSILVQLAALLIVVVWSVMAAAAAAQHETLESFWRFSMVTVGLTVLLLALLGIIRVMFRHLPAQVRFAWPLEDPTQADSPGLNDDPSPAKG